MLFSERSELDLFLALGGVVAALIAIVPPAVAELGPPLGPLLAAAVTVPTVLNLIRYRRAPLGCAVLPLGFLACGAAFLLGRGPTERAVLLGAPNLAFLIYDMAVVPALAAAAARNALLALGQAASAAGEGPYLAYPAPEVRAAAAAALGRRPWAEAAPVLEPHLRGDAPATRAAAFAALAALGRAAPGEVRDLLLALHEGPAPAEAAHALALHDPELSAARPDDPRPAVRLARALGLRQRAAVTAARLLVSVAAAADASEAERQAALEATDPPEEVVETRWRDALREALRKASWEQPTPEQLWVLCENGASPDALLAARHVASDDFTRANAAIEAVSGILSRDGKLGEATTPVRAALEAAKAKLREVHPAGDNQLADYLVERTDGVLEALGGPSG